MRLAWFRPRSIAPESDEPAPLLDELARRHDIHVFDERRAHDFVWQQARHPFDLPVYELADRPDCAYMWAYLVRYPGLLDLRSPRLSQSRASILAAARRTADYDAELAVSRPRGLGIPVRASRITVVADAMAVDALQAAFPDASVRLAPLAAAAPAAPGHTSDGSVVVVTDAASGPIVRRAVARLHGGTAVEMRIARGTGDAGDGDIAVVLEWPPPLAASPFALHAFAAGRPTVVFETEATAAWPTLDPQTWQPRAVAGSASPIAVSIDPRDAEHSVMLALRRLAADAALRRRLGTAARAWWRAHASPEVAAAAWEPILAEAAVAPAPALPANWPAHFTADGTEVLRTLLADFPVTIDVVDEPDRRSGQA